MAKVILGIDEAGRGPYAGPLVVGACILRTKNDSYNYSTSKSQAKNEAFPNWIMELNDSKKLSKKRRERLYPEIKANAPASATGWVTSIEIDELGMAEALRLATRRAVEKIQKQGAYYNEIIIDGPENFLEGTSLEKYVVNLNKGDSLVKEVSAASILAKVERDKYMTELAEKYPEYGFDKNAGYGTEQHQAAMKKYGLTPEHRRLVKPVAAIAKANGEEITPRKKQPKKNTTGIGNKGENKIAMLLEKKGHRIVSRNYKTKYYEIDIVSRKNGTLYFTEVKTRKSDEFGEPSEFIDQKKLEKMKLAAECFNEEFFYADNLVLAVGTYDVSKKQIDWFELS